ncbi:thioredoxin domain-containing protein [Cellulomonas sp. PhB143]|uniref:DsbA family protein n=1 Tax=Cellulomonas sp. PhB143 TaxID=2485186 RepID=UPI000F48742E|nr:thioredoxin domain-containing protein [Cellulomonas sp. PhB143]ROS78783.1 protein-disulfide isomerase [Cellulomonas sp. PhB143]
MNQQNQSKAQRREAAIAEAKRLRDVQAARDKRVRIITISALVVALVAIVAIVLFILREGDKPAIDRADAPATASDDGGIPLGTSGAAGTTNDGAVDVAVYLDYMCPICGEFEKANGQTLDDLRESGDVTEILHPISILDSQSQGSKYSTRAASAAALVADQAPDAMADFNDAMFASQPKEGTAGLTDEQIQQIAESAKVPADVAKKIGDGSAVDAFGSWVSAATDLAGGDSELQNPQGGFGTPTITIDGKRWDGDWSKDGALEDAVKAAQG